MPEPGINDGTFDRPTTKPVPGPQRGRRTGKRPRAPIKVPAEYADFQLDDGRALIDVLGESFFETEGGESLPESTRKQLASGNPALAGMFDGNPRFRRGPAAAKRTLDPGNAGTSGASMEAFTDFGTPAGSAALDDDNEAEYTNLPFGPEEGNAGENSADLPKSGTGPAGIGAGVRGWGLESAGEPEFTSADILDPRDRQEFENLTIATESAGRKIALHEDRLDLIERRFKNKRIDARAMGRARRYFEFRIGQQEVLIARNEDRLTEIRAAALLDAAALSPGDTPRAGDAREDGAPAFPTARPRPATIGGGMPGGAEAAFNSDGGYWTFGLPLTAEGQVDESALRPGAVYRIPDSAGGGTGQWKNGAFYNFDQKGDWRFRTAADLDAYSGVSDALTPEERWEQTIDDADKAFMPAARLDVDDIQEFTEKTGYGLTRVEGGLTLTDPSGRKLFDLAKEDAAELARIWSPEIADRVAIIGLLWREDLSPAEKRKPLEEAVNAGKPVPGRILTDRREVADYLAKATARNLDRKRLDAFDAVAEAMERGASDEEIGELLGEFHAAMLPEVLGSERFVREFLMDLVPGLGNVRSFRHLQNDIAEVERAIEIGEWGDAAWASGMAILDAVGIVPGGNLLKAGGKLAGRGLVKAVPYLDGLLAERTIRRFKAQWLNPKGPVPGAKEFFGEGALTGLTDTQIKSLNGLLRNRFGVAGGEEYLWTLGKRMDPKIKPKVHKQFSVDLAGVPNALSETRKFDLLAAYRSDILAEKNALLGRFARWFVGAGQRADDGAQLRTGFELKLGDQAKPPRERIPDDYFNDNPTKAADKDFRSIDDLRMHVDDVPIEFVLEDLPKHLENAVRKGKLSRGEKYLLTLAMNRMHANGILGIPVDKYATLLARVGAGTARRIEIEPDEDPTAISPFQP